MSSLDGAVTSITGVSEEVFDEFGSAFGSEEAVMGGGQMGKNFGLVIVPNVKQLDSKTLKSR